MALLGAINHLLPYWIVKQIARRTSKDKDHWATNTVFAGLVVFPFFYVLQLGAAWLFLPKFWASVYTVALPYCGYYALQYRDRFRLAFRLCERTFIYFYWHPERQRELAAEGTAIIERIRQLAAHVEGEPLVDSGMQKTIHTK